MSSECLAFPSKMLGAGSQRPDDPINFDSKPISFMAPWPSMSLLELCSASAANDSYRSQGAAFDEARKAKPWPRDAA